ncbi:MAG: phosphatidate cytidylyltransferase [Candidatus Izemoplasmataceae bacterium]
MKTRIITGGLMGLFFIPIFIFGGWILYSVLGLMSVFASYEMLNMVKTKTVVPKSVFVFVLAYNLLFYLVVIYSAEQGIILDVVLPLLLGLILLGSLLMVFIEDMSFDLFAKSILAMMYPVLGFVSLAIIREESLAFLGLLFVITVSTDIFAYFVGVSIGKHKLAPKISPKKSIEGSIGGLVFAVLFSILYIFLINLGNHSIDLSFWMVGLLAMLASVMAQVGDLVASKMKRTYGIKDFSQIFPGHGGIMDRFDSSLFAAMMVVALVVLELI